MFEIGFNQFFDDIRHFVLRERRADDLAQRRRIALRPADGDLVELRPLLVDAENADVADVVVAAGIHAAGNIQVEFADVMLVIQIIKAALDCFRHRNRLGIGQRAEIAAGTGDDVGDQADVRCRQTQQLGFQPQRVQIGLTHVGQHQILFMRYAQFAETVTVGEIGHRIHLIGGCIARRNTGLFQ